MLCKLLVKKDSTMAAIIGIEALIEEVCNNASGVIVTANYNSPNQLVISGETKTIQQVCKKLTAWC